MAQKQWETQLLLDTVPRHRAAMGCYDGHIDFDFLKRIFARDELLRAQSCRSSK
jgi:hypothetical protein